MSNVLIFQNYYSPARDSLFREMHASGVELTVLYAHRPQDEGRQWLEPDDVPYHSVQLRHFTAMKHIFFWVPRRFRRSEFFVILSDNNPTNLCTIAWALAFRLTGCRIALWVEHIPDRFKGRAKFAFQKACTRILSRLSHRVVAFSEMTERYLGELAVSRPINRMVQATTPLLRPTPPRPTGPIRSFGYLGSGDRRKNVAALIAAFARLSRPAMKLHIAGFEGEADDERIIWHGYVAGPAREAFFEAIDVLVLPSLADPWGFVANEAFDRGRLAIVTEACGSAELAKRVSPKLVCTPDVAGLTAALAHVLALDEAEVGALIGRASSAMEDYSVTAAAARLAAIVQRL
jgi:glycosyltransferase involved in cell wall biosynthesis